MPCPPSYEEQRADSGETLARLGAEKASRLREVQGLLRELASGSTLEALGPVLELDAQVRLGRRPDYWNDPTQVEPMFAWADQAAVEHKRLKIALCEASTALVRLWDVTPEAARTPERAARYASLETAHREHREQDRHWVLREIRQRRSWVAKGSEEDRRLASLERQASALDVEVLLRDRDALVHP